MAKRLTFDEAGAKRIVKSVRWTEGAQKDTTGQRRRFVTSATDRSRRAVPVAGAQFAPNRWQYTARDLEAWNPTTHSWDTVAEPPDIVLYNDWEELNTATMLRGSVPLGSNVSVLPAPELPVQLFPTGEVENDKPVYVFEFPNDPICGGTP